MLIFVPRCSRKLISSGSPASPLPREDLLPLPHLNPTVDFPQHHRSGNSPLLYLLPKRCPRWRTMLQPSCFSRPHHLDSVQAIVSPNHSMQTACRCFETNQTRNPSGILCLRKTINLGGYHALWVLGRSSAHTKTKIQSAVGPHFAPRGASPFAGGRMG